MTVPVNKQLFMQELRARRAVSPDLADALDRALDAGGARVGFNHDAFMHDLRLRLGRVPQGLYDDVMVAVNVGMGRTLPPRSLVAAATEPAYITEARKHIGLREIVGTKHNPIILGFWKLLGRPYKDDETPWCGGFVGYCIAKAGLALPDYPERAASWATWGKPCNPVKVGAIGVKQRKGGNHVFFIIGQSENQRYWVVLEGNANNMVKIGRILKVETFAVRWPNELAIEGLSPPKLAAGQTSGSEA